jgi:ComF family protein
MEHPPAYTKAWTLYPYLPPLQDAICLLKYRGKVALVPELADLMIERLPPVGPVDVIMPVPLHPRRLREREFNQSLLLADRLSQRTKIPLSFTNLVRVRPSPPQTSLSRKDRRRNLRGAFAVRDRAAVKGKRVLLIDDVFTTGATVNESAKALRKAGSGDVYALTLARTMDTALVPDRLLAQRAQPPWGLP